MRGRILEVPNLLDYTLLWEPQRGVAVLADVSREGCRWSDRRSYNAGFPRQRDAVVRDARSCCNSVEFREGALVSDRRIELLRSTQSRHQQNLHLLATGVNPS